MSILTNQFRMGPTVGAICLTTNPNPATMTVRYNPDATETLEVGEVVKLVDLGATDPNGVPIVEKRESNSDRVFGVRLYGTKEGETQPGDVCEVIILTGVVWMKAEEAVERGASVEPLLAAGYVQNFGVARILGVALDKARAKDDLIRVYIFPDFIGFSGENGINGEVLD